MFLLVSASISVIYTGLAVFKSSRLFLQQMNQYWMMKVADRRRKETARTMPTLREMLLKMVFSEFLQVLDGGPSLTSTKKKKLPKSHRPLHLNASSIPCRMLNTERSNLNFVGSKATILFWKQL